MERTGNKSGRGPGSVLYVISSNAVGNHDGQRIPVRIDFDRPQSPDFNAAGLLKPGLSVKPEVRVRGLPRTPSPPERSPGDRLKIAGRSAIDRQVIGVVVQLAGRGPYFIIRRPNHSRIRCSAKSLLKVKTNLLPASPAEAVVARCHCEPSRCARSSSDSHLSAEFTFAADLATILSPFECLNARTALYAVPLLACADSGCVPGSRQLADDLATMALASFGSCSISTSN